MKIEISDTIVDLLQTLIDSSGLDITIENYVEWVLRDVLAKAKVEDAPALSDEEKEMVQIRLKALGYID